MREYKEYYVYILASGRNGTLYTGVTNDLVRRIGEHKSGKIRGFTQKHKVNLLVYFESTDDIGAAIQKEKQIKSWHRAWKIKMIQAMNPAWRDLYSDISQG